MERPGRGGLGEGLRTQRVLVVDDDEAVVGTIQQILTRSGVGDIRTTTDPRRVLSLFQEAPPDLVMMDIHMPALDGYVVLRQLTARIPEGEFLPILVVSGDLAPDAKQKALSLGASDFVAKPFDAIELQLRVRNMLRLRDMTAQL